MFKEHVITLAYFVQAFFGCVMRTCFCAIPHSLRDCVMIRFTFVIQTALFRFRIRDKELF